ncbi:hypothetical protein DFH28DRAFT_936423 [Melampsora americana]|nr:hypothetical protein DFH28DRAFT_936423 [Melampsora americana]
MGLKENDNIPSSATPSQQSTWKIYTFQKDMLLLCCLDREMASNLTFSLSNPRFPFKGGPGGENSNPQILLVMWTMMKRVGVFSFRPIWEEGMNSPANKFLFSLASAVFIHLVKAGEYDDINSQDAKFDPVCAALKEHARCSLKRLFQQTNEWLQAKIRAHKQQGVRASSEDETNNELEPTDSPKKVFKVKKFKWQTYNEQKKKDSPKNTPGAKPQNQVRDSLNPLISQSQAPPGLPSDCYDPDWLEELRNNNPDRYEQLQVDPTTVLEGLEKQANICLKL